jgi:hypothetical protein
VPSARPGVPPARPGPAWAGVGGPVPAVCGVVVRAPGGVWWCRPRAGAAAPFPGGRLWGFSGLGACWSGGV